MSALTKEEIIAARQPAKSLASVLEATRQSLVEQIHDLGDHTGWQRFFEVYGGAIHGLALKAGLSQTEADDVLQETMISVAEKIPMFVYDPGQGSFKGWLFQITRRRIADHFRKKRPETELPRDLEEAPALLESEWDIEWKQTLLRRALDNVRNKISPAQWQMFELSGLQQWPMDKIVGFTGANRAQVYMAKVRVTRLLKQEVTRLSKGEFHTQN